MKHEDLLRVCLQNLLRRKSRTFLTVLGVLIGCCSIVIMVSLGIGMKESQEKLLAELGDLTIITVTAPQKGKGKKKLDDNLLKSIREMDGVEGVTPKLSFDTYTCRLLAGPGGLPAHRRGLPCQSGRSGRGAVSGVQFPGHLPPRRVQHHQPLGQFSGGRRRIPAGAGPLL